MPSQAHSIRLLAAALAAGPFDDAEAMKARVKPMVGDLRKARWLDSLARMLTMEFGAAPRPTVHQVAGRIARHPPFVKAWMTGGGRIIPVLFTPEMIPAPGAPRGWSLPALATTGELADRLRVHPDDLGWLTGRGRTEHYLHHWRAKPKTGRFRLIESPKALLKHVQRQVLRRILEAIPPHEAATGFRKGSSVRDFVTPHAGREIVVRFDLEDFFPSITAARVLRLFLTAGYPEPVARTLVLLTTHATASRVLEQRSLSWDERRRLATPHLPQGAPSSPALANLCAFRLDCRLAGLAKAAGARYTRYADDLLFSGGGDFARQAGRFITAVGAIVIEEGFLPHHRKTRVMRSGRKQHAAGMVLNEKPNLDRREFDRLKAILTNCVRHGPASQNREGHADFAAHLLGKLAWVEFINPAKGAKLDAIWQRIRWESD